MRNPTFKYYADICECGNPKHKTSKRCARCNSASSTRLKTKWAYQYDECPNCHGPKKKTAKACRGCTAVKHTIKEVSDKNPWYGVVPDYSHIPEWFWAWLSGFVCGEGSIGFQSGNCLRLSINLHKDDQATLSLLKDTLGGSFFYNSEKRKLATWTINGAVRVSHILKKLLPYAEYMKSLKVNDMKVAIEFTDWRIQFGKFLPEDQKPTRDEFFRRMKAVKVRSKIEA